MPYLVISDLVEDYIERRGSLRAVRSDSHR